MPISRQQLDEVHEHLDAATRAVEALITARVLKDDAKVEEAIKTISTEQGATKYSLRGVQPDS